MHRERGTTTVEMAVAGAAFFLVLFAALEVGRLFFTLHGLTEGTRRGARVAAVCPQDHPAILNVASFGDPASGAGGLIPAVTADKFIVEYLDASGNVTATYLDIRYVRVSVSNFNHVTIIPGAVMSIDLAGFSTTVPRESLGVPREGVVECVF
jgi:Flp pilus assembly protein TadG